jgi:hypothetical protein
MAKGAAIVGRVTDETGDPVVAAQLSLGMVQMIGTEAHLVPVPRQLSETNDLGEYRIGDLPAGRYFLSAAGAGLGSVPNGMPREWERLAAWGPTFYPGVASLADASAIVVSTGEERPATDFAVLPVSPATLTLTITGLPPVPSVGLVSMTPAGGVLNARTRTLTFSSRGGAAAISTTTTLDAGEWIVVAREGSSGAMAHVTLVSGDDASLSLSLGAGGRLAGRVIFHGSSLAPPFSAVRLDVRGADSEAGVAPRALLRAPVAPKADGVFLLDGLLGAVQLQVTPPQGWAVESIKAGDRDLLDGSVSFKSGESVAGVQIALSDRPAALAGAVVDSDGKPAPGCVVAVVPDQRELRLRPNRARLQRADQHGMFAVNGLPPGQYLSVAAADIDAASWLTDEFLDRLRRRATPLTIGAGERGSLTLLCGSAP